MKLVISLTLLFSFSALAKTVARVADYGGKSFIFMENGQSKELRYGDKIPDLSQLMVDDNAYVTLVDEQGNIHHMAGGSYVKFFNNLLEVQNGYVWTKAKSEGKKIINTINSVIKYEKGEFITTVNSGDNRSQLLVIYGEPEFASSTESHLSIPVKSGEFTFIDKSYERGLPRRPTRVGIKSYYKIKGVFANISTLKTNSFEKTLNGNTQSVKREIASVPSSNPTKKGNVIYIKTYGDNSRAPQSVNPKEPSAYDYYKKVRRKKRSKKRAKVKYFGFEFKESPKVTTKVKPITNVTPRITITPPKKSDIQDRQPASVAPKQVTPQPNNIINDINSVFEKSYRNNVKQNTKHSNEVNDLIDELKTFRNDFKKNY